jgi:hypothetical protein
MRHFLEIFCDSTFYVKMYEIIGFVVGIQNFGSSFMHDDYLEIKISTYLFPGDDSIYIA